MERPLRGADWAAIAVSLVLPTGVTWLYFVALDDAPAPQQQGAFAVGKTIQFALPIVWVWLVQRQRPRWKSPGSKGLTSGGLFGMAVATAIVLLYFGLLKPSGMFDQPAEAVRTKVQGFGAGSPAVFIVMGVFYSALHSLLEEYYWRWFVFGQLARGCKLAMAVGISSVAFAAHHVLVLAHYFGWLSPLTCLFTASVAVGGAIWAIIYRQSGSLYASWLSHALVDAAIFAIGYHIIA
jgi:CAAX protease family protein